MIVVHNMLGFTSHLVGSLKPLTKWLFFVLVLCVALSAFTSNRGSVFFDGRVYFTDGDCYARMTRVRLLQEHPLTPIRHHDFENYPEGTHPHTTAPLDYLIAGLAAILSPFFGNSLELAGAWVSPLLGLATLAFLFLWGRGKPFAAATVILLAISPIVSHGFLLGRPDHQSLLLLLIAIALAAEIRVWNEGSGGMLSAAAWGAALWVSLFEPVILLGVVLVARLCTRRLRFAWRPVAFFLGILMAAFILDGFRAGAFDARFSNWAKNIGELRHGSLGLFFSWAGWMVLPAPLILLIRFFRGRDPVCFLFAVLLLFLGGLTFWHVRWGYFLVLVFALSLPCVLPFFRWRWVGWVALVGSLWPVAAAWELSLYPDDQVFRERVESVADGVALRDAAFSLRDLPRRGVIAPWWFSPAVVWWSGQPCVGGTSHQSLPGIADTAEFFLSGGDGGEILSRRDVAYVIAYEPDRVISNSALILNRAAPANPLARRLYQNRGRGLIHANRFFRVYDFSKNKTESPAGGTPPSDR
ncbi:MAG: hypothetical protein D4R65_15985 [Verrucomicrobiaceae bacterium]|nr:MAG: hypothetical protein D4R65_15985 [Verrucomicrobiaceae bacterium]